jgi:hypothetical protein
LRGKVDDRRGRRVVAAQKCVDASENAGEEEGEEAAATGGGGGEEAGRGGGVSSGMEGRWS